MRSTAEIHKVVWSTLSKEQWRRYSVVTVTEPSSKDGGADEDKTNTPYDSRLGEQNNKTACGTCGKTNIHCPGHFGIIELPFPMYNKNFATITLKLLQSICRRCSRPLLTPEHMESHGFMNMHGSTRLMKIAAKCDSSIKMCPWEGCCEPVTRF